MTRRPDEIRQYRTAIVLQHDSSLHLRNLGLELEAAEYMLGQGLAQGVVEPIGEQTAGLREVRLHELVQVLAERAQHERVACAVLGGRSRKTVAKTHHPLRGDIEQGFANGASLAAPSERSEINGLATHGQGREAHGADAQRTNPRIVQSKSRVHSDQKPIH